MVGVTVETILHPFGAEFDMFGSVCVWRSPRVAAPPWSDVGARKCRRIGPPWDGHRHLRDDDINGTSGVVSYIGDLRVNGGQPGVVVHRGPARHRWYIGDLRVTGG